MIVDWKKEIAVAWYVQNETAKLDVKKLWQYHMPNVAATEEDLRKTENLLGFSIDPMYRRFLGFANGWRCFYQHVDLFGTNELSGGEVKLRAESMLDYIETESFVASGIARSDVMPIAYSAFQADVFVQLKQNRRSSGIVIWFAGHEIERFANFDDFFLATVDYNRVRLERFRLDRIESQQT